MKTWFGVVVLLFALFGSQNILGTPPNVDPLNLEFKMLAVRRFVFSNNITLCEFTPSRIVSFKSMHPAFTISQTDNKK